MGKQKAAQSLNSPLQAWASHQQCAKGGISDWEIPKKEGGIEAARDKDRLECTPCVLYERSKRHVEKKTKRIGRALRREKFLKKKNGGISAQQMGG